MTITKAHPAISRAVFVLIASACASPLTPDDWGSPAGYATVIGTVSRSGAPAANVEVTMTRCSSPIGGLLGSATSDVNGAYSIHGHLAPRGILIVNADTLRVRCTLFADRAGAPLLDTIVPFASTEVAVQPLRVDVALPP